MLYQKIKKFLDNTPDQHSKFRIKYWIEIKDDTGGTDNNNSLTDFDVKVKFI